MIKINCPDEFIKTVEFATAHNCLAQFMKNIERISGYGDGEQLYTCELYADRAPLSFQFAIMRPDSSRWINGGLIYSGPGQPLDGSGPAFTVGIGLDSMKHQWSVHT
jgi:hypothetical protein